MFRKTDKTEKVVMVSDSEEKPLEATDDLLIENTAIAEPAAESSEPVKEEKEEKAAEAVVSKKDKKAESTGKIERKSAPKKEESKKNTSGTIEISWKNADPIVVISAIVFFAACFVVIGATIYDVTCGDHSEKVAEYGDSVYVDYTGSYYDYYTNGGAVFDTTLSDVANGDYRKSYEFTSKDSYSNINFTIGGGSYLAMFENSIINHRPGDTIYVQIPAENGYGALTDATKKTVSKTQTISPSATYTTDQYTTFFGVDDAPAAGSTATVTSPYGWDAKVTTGTNGMVYVDYQNLKADDEFTMSDKVSVKIVTVSSDEIKFKYVINDFKLDADMVKVYIDGVSVYVISSDGENMTYKTTEEKVGATLFFVIKFVKYEEETTSS